jgi:4-amino-4-deoxy-L-arabinose transferase-like glycosyltransferase
VEYVYQVLPLFGHLDEMLMYLIALVILLISSLPWVAVSRPLGKSAWLMSMFLVSSASAVLAGYIANSFRLLNQQWFMLAIHIMIGVIGFLIWRQAGKYPMLEPFNGWRPRLTVEGMKREPILVLLIVSIFLAYAFALAQVVLVPQNNMDSLSTHLSRIGFWHQNGSFFPWPTTMLNQVWYPVNAQLLTYWTLLFLGSDQLVGGIQWLAALVSALGVFGLARLFGYGTRPSIFASLIFLSFPLVALQSTTTQTDLVTTVFFLLAVYFLIAGLRNGQFSLLSLSAVSIGIGIGVKKSFLVLLPVLIVLALLALWQFGRRSVKPLIYWSVNAMIAVLLFGVYGYAVNWYYFGNPFGSPTYVESLVENPQVQDAGVAITTETVPISQRNNANPSILTTDSPAGGGGVWLEILYNTPRLFYQSLDTSGLPRPLDGYAHKVKERLMRGLFKLIGFTEIEGTAYTAPGHEFNFSDKNVNEESHAWYGPLSALLIFPALILETIRGIRQKQPLLAGPAAALLIFLPLEIILRPGWDPFQGRYFAPLIALCAPLIAFWFKEKGNAWYEWLICGLAILIISVTLLYNPSKPTLGEYADDYHIWNNDRMFIQTIQRKKDRDVYYTVEEFVPQDSTLGYYTPFFIMDYPLFGKKLTRRLVPLVSTTQISDLQWLREQGIDYLLLPRRDEYPSPPLEYQVISHWPGWRLYFYNTPQ